MADGDLPRILPLLDMARALPLGAGTDEEGTGLFTGLSQAAKLSAASHLAYRHALERVMLPRLIWQLEAQLRGAMSRPDFLYEATRIYLMLGNQGPLDRDLVRDWMAADWANSYAGVTRAPVRDGLLRHLDALLAGPLPTIPLDGQLVSDVRRTFGRVSLAERVYSRIRPGAAAQRIAPWIPADAIGSSGDRVFTRPSGKPMTDGIAGFYTVEGFHRVLLPSLAATVRDVVAESWVLGTDIAPANPAPTLEADVVALYCNEYGRLWDALLGDLAVVPLRDLPTAVQNLYLLSSPQSPMRELTTSIARQLTLSVPPPGLAAAAAAAPEKPATAASRAFSAPAPGAAPPVPAGPGDRRPLP